MIEGKSEIHRSMDFFNFWFGPVKVKICFLKERLKINKIAKYESDLLKTKDDIALKSCKDDADICI